MSALIHRNATQKCVCSVNKVKHESHHSREISPFRHQEGLGASAGHVDVCVCVRVLEGTDVTLDYETDVEQPWCLCGDVTDAWH